MPHRNFGPVQPEVRDGFVGENVFPFEDIGELASRHSGVPTHRKPGAQKKAAPPNADQKLSATYPDR